MGALIAPLHPVFIDGAGCPQAADVIKQESPKVRHATKRIDGLQLRKENLSNLTELVIFPGLIFLSIFFSFLTA